MAEECPFCLIAEEEIPARVVAEDDATLAFLDAEPLAAGHTLVVPKVHESRLEALSEAVASDLYDTLHNLVPVVEDVVEADGATVAFNDGEAAGQEVPHVHGHIIPRFDDDHGGPIHAVLPERPDIADSDLETIANGIRAGH